MNRFLRILLIIAGSIALGLGILGIFLPLLPTTPFLLLAAACYARSSNRFHDWLLGHRIFGEYIRNYRDHRAIKLRAKVLGITMLWLTIGISIFFVSYLWLKLLLAVIAIVVTLHLLSLKTIRS
ncbi:MAG: YbaN family protein [Dehalogenimonas sp.]